MLPPCGAQLGAGRGTGAQRAVQVDVDDLREDLGVMLAAAAQDAGAVDQHVERRQRIDAGADGSVVAHVQHRAFRTGERGILRRGFDLGGGRTGHVDPRALQQEGRRDAGADAGRAADHQHLAAGEHLGRKRVGRIHAAPVESIAARTCAIRGIGSTAP